jgi:hypothetical protein
MKNGLKRFIFYTDQITILLKQARVESNPAMWLFTNNGRTPFFMLEGLAKIYASMHNAIRFGKIKAHFKLIEDSLGQIDYFNWLSVALKGNNQIPEEYKQYIEKQLVSKVTELNQMLIDKGWLTDDGRRIKKITKKLNEAGWLNPAEEVEAISSFYKTSIADITEFVAKTNYHFENVENDVHELRRRLRWLSIYPQALQGIIQYAADTRSAAQLKKYLTTEIVNSPYNRLPDPGYNTTVFLLHKNYFLALSWMIAQLGILKDEGLLLTGLIETIKQVTDCIEEEAPGKALTLLGGKQRKMQEILYDSEVITKMFFKENNLQHLIAGKTKLT